MQLTNKTNNSYFWRESGNRFFIEIDGKPVELKYTLNQNEAYRALIDDGRNSSDKADDKFDVIEHLQMRITRSLDHAQRVVTIALNPRADVEISLDDVRELFSEQLDLLQIIAHTWVDKKIFNPALSKALDPLLAP